MGTAFISDPSLPDPNVNCDPELNKNILTVAHLLEIAKGKCDFKTRQIVEIVRRHVGGQYVCVSLLNSKDFAYDRMFEWDASLVRDGTYYAATLLAKNGGADADLALCIQALNVSRDVISRAVRDLWLMRRNCDGPMQRLGTDQESESSSSVHAEKSPSLHPSHLPYSSRLIDAQAPPRMGYFPVKSLVERPALHRLESTFT
jgi:hypothetical protein